MAEERIIDDEYGRGVRLRKTKEGYVDVTDEAVDGERGVEEGAAEEISFAFPILEGEEDDEDLVGLSPEEAVALRKQKAEAAQRQREEYERTVAEGNELLKTDSFHAAELKFEKALQLDALATDASVGYWKAKTANFTNPDVLIDEYVEAGIESLEYDLGYEAVDIIKKEHRDVFQRRYDELKAQEDPLFLEVTSTQERRRTILKGRKIKGLIGFVCSALPMLAFVILALVFGVKNFTVSGTKYIPVTIVMAGLSVVSFIVFTLFTNKWINACRMYATNEKLDSTEEGEELSRIMEYRNLYGELLEVNYEEEEDSEAEEIE